MPVRRELLGLYPQHWSALAAHVKRTGRCVQCGRPHLQNVRCLPDGRWFDSTLRGWRDGRGQALRRWPELMELTEERVTRVVLAACHVDGNPRNNRLRNLRAWCQRCHLAHDRPLHAAQRWLTVRRRYAIGDLFLGLYDVQVQFRLRRGRPSRPVRRQVRIRMRLTGEARLPLLAPR